MAVIGTFSAVNDGYAGSIRTLTVNARVKILANDRKESEGAAYPPFRFTWMMRLVALWWMSRLPSRVGRMWRMMPAWTFPDGIAQLWNVSVFGSNRTSVSGRIADSLYHTAPLATARA